jgi:3-oxoacyl-[acyl-carrier protein] reductase
MTLTSTSCFARHREPLKNVPRRPRRASSRQKQLMEDLMSHSGILQGKRAVVLGAGGSVGAAVAREFAGEGADVFLAGRTRSSLDEVARLIAANESRAHVQVLDALDETAVTQYIDGIVERTGRIDVVFNAVGPLARDYGNGRSAIDLTAEQFMLPVDTVLKAQFISARAAARHMVKQRSGVIVLLTGAPAGAHIHGATAIGAAFGAVEALARNLALDVSPAGVRVVCVRSSAMTDSRTIQHTMDMLADRMNLSKEQVLGNFASLTMLKMTASVNDTARLAAFVASDKARMLTSNVVNSTGGAVED